MTCPSCGDALPEGSCLRCAPANGTWSAQAGEDSGSPPWPHATKDGARAAAGERYRDPERIGEGGTGEVQSVHDTVLRREVAIKRLRATGASARDRFVAEAQVTAQLDHPNIVPVHDLGTDADGRPFLVMKRVRGRSLTDILLAEPKPSIEQKLRIFQKICDAVSYAHAHRVLHRDLKPDNVMVGAFGEVLVMDWGLARPLGGAATAGGPSVHASGSPEIRQDEPEEYARDRSGALLQVDRFEGDALRTRNGQVAGTPAFMAPEQAAGRLDALDARTDIYSLGAVLYALIIGRPPFEGTAGSVLAAVREGRPAPIRAGVPRELAAIVRRAMALRPEDRYASVELLCEDIEAFLAYRPLPHVRSTVLERLTKWARRHDVAVRAGFRVAAIAGMLLLAGLGRYASDVGEARDRALEEARRATSAEQVARAQLVAARIALSDSCSERGDITGTGTALREAAAVAAGLDMDRRALEWALSANAVRRPPPVATCTMHPEAPILTLAVSKDGGEVTSLGQDGTLVTWAVDGCARREQRAVGRVDRAVLGYGAGGARGLVARDGEVVAIWDGRVLAPAKLPIAPGAAVSLVRLDGSVGYVAGTDGRTFRLDVRTGVATLLPAGPSAGAVWWRKGATRIAISEPKGNEIAGAWRDDGRSYSGTGVVDVDVTSDGRFAVIASPFGHTLEEVGSGHTGWEHADGATRSVHVSDDDQRVIVTRFDGSVHVDHLSDGVSLAQIEGNVDGSTGAVGASADARVVAVARPGGRVEVYLVPRREPLRLPVQFDSLAHAADLSPDGRLLAVGGDDGVVRILDAASGATVRVAGGFVDGVRHARFSRDGRTLLLGLRAGAVGLLDLATGQLRRWEVGGRAPSLDWIDADTIGVVSSLGVAWRIEPAQDRLVELGKVSDSSTWDGVAVPGTSWLAVDGHTVGPTATSVVVDIRDGRVVSRREHPGARYRIAAAPDGRTVVSGTGAGDLEVWDPATGAVLRTIRADSGPTMGVGFSPDGRLLASIGFDAALDLWDTRTWTLIRSVQLYDAPGTAAEFAPDGSAVLTTGGTGAILFPLEAHTRHAAAVEALAGPPAGRPAALAALGWWERVGAALDEAVAAGAPDDPALRERAARALDPVLPSPAQ